MRVVNAISYKITMISGGLIIQKASARTVTDRESMPLVILNGMSRTASHHPFTKALLKFGSSPPCSWNRPFSKMRGGWRGGSDCDIQLGQVPHGWSRLAGGAHALRRRQRRGDGHGAGGACISSPDAKRRSDVSLWVF